MLLASMAVCPGLFAQSWGDAVVDAKRHVASSLAAANMPVSEVVRRGERPKSVTVDVAGLDKIAMLISVTDRGTGNDQLVLSGGKLTAADGTVTPLENVQRDYYELPQAPSYNQNYYRRPIRVAGDVIGNGIVMRPNGEFVLKLDKKYKTLTVDLSLDDFSSREGAVRVDFQNVASHDVLASFSKMSPAEVNDFVKLGGVFTPAWINELNGAQIEKRAAERLNPSLRRSTYRYSTTPRRCCSCRASSNGSIRRA